MYRPRTAKEPTRSDTFELLSPQVVQDDTSSSSNSKRMYLRPFTSAKQWYQRSVLLSGKNYLRVDTGDRPAGLRYGWRVGSFISCVFVGAVLCFNAVFTIHAIRMNPPSEDGVGKLKHGPCQQILSLSTWIHIAINVCSTIVVAASNYNMQCLTAPTRIEIDEAHQKKKHMQIGIQSVKNLRQVRPWKVLLWTALLLSTLPLHLLWNSAIFSITTINEYSGLVVTSSFLEASLDDYGVDCSQEAMRGYQEPAYGHNRSSNVEAYTTCWLLSQAKAGNLTKVSSHDCINRYTVKLETAGYNLIAVANSSRTLSSVSFPANASQPVLAYFNSMEYTSKLASWCRNQCPDPAVWCKPGLGPGVDDPCRLAAYGSLETNKALWCNAPDWDGSHTSYACYQHVVNGSSWSPTSIQGSSDWICDPDEVYSGECSVPAALMKSSPWTILPEAYVIDHCLVSEAEFDCELQYSSSILYAVITCNAIKLFAILLHIIFARDPILATVGDAVASFLRRPDTSSEHNCLYTSHDQQLDFYRPAKRWLGHPGWKPRVWTNDPKRVQHWMLGTSWRYLAMCCITWLSCLIVSGSYFQSGLELMGGQTVLEAGFGAMNIGALVAISSYKGGTNASILTTSLVVNTPQVIFSSLYFMYNATYTCMTSAHEWSLFAHNRKALRVTTPAGSQRSSYWLQLPWKFSLPLMAVSALLHWLISQSIFLVNARIQQPTNRLLTGADEYFQMASESGTITAVGFSPLAVILAIVVGTLMLLCLLVVCNLRLKPGMVLVGSNSFAISAACHPHPDDRNADLKPLLWGAVEHQEGLKPGHCCFSSFDVDEPKIGDMYA